MTASKPTPQGGQAGRHPRPWKADERKRWIIIDANGAYVTGASSPEGAEIILAAINSQPPAPATGEGLDESKPQQWADPDCKTCGGVGWFTTTDPIYAGWRWCPCAVRNRAAAPPPTPPAVAPQCQHREWSDDDQRAEWAEADSSFSEHPNPTGPQCPEPATHLSCQPSINTPTCAAHKCRCAKPLPPSVPAEVSEPDGDLIPEATLAELERLLDESTPGVWKTWGCEAMADQAGDSDHAKAVPVARFHARRTFDLDLTCLMRRTLPAFIAAARGKASAAERVDRLEVERDAWRDNAYDAQAFRKRVEQQLTESESRAARAEGELKVWQSACAEHDSDILNLARVLEGKEPETDHEGGIFHNAIVARAHHLIAGLKAKLGESECCVCGEPGKGPLCTFHAMQLDEVQQLAARTTERDSAHARIAELERRVGEMGAVVEAADKACHALLEGDPLDPEAVEHQIQCHAATLPEFCRAIARRHESALAALLVFDEEFGGMISIATRVRSVDAKGV